MAAWTSRLLSREPGEEQPRFPPSPLRKKLDKAGWDSLIKAGMEGVEPDRESFRVAVKPVWDNFITKTNTGDWIKAVTSA